MAGDSEEARLKVDNMDKVIEDAIGKLDDGVTLDEDALEEAQAAEEELKDAFQRLEPHKEVLAAVVNIDPDNDDPVEEWNRVIDELGRELTVEELRDTLDDVEIAHQEAQDAIEKIQDIHERFKGAFKLEDAAATELRKVNSALGSVEMAVERAGEFLENHRESGN